ncbi:MAG: hypothetical protein JXA22_08610 [Candidatus Thermoplasmatota archaeon]|nr:hypothetical protein [Candidatus Thermoplasmatota archaeon]
MDWTGKKVKWISRLAIGLGFGGLVLLLAPFLCYIAPFLSQAGVLFGLFGFAKYGKEEDRSNKMYSIVGMIGGILGLILFCMMFIFDWAIW